MRYFLSTTALATILGLGAAQAADLRPVYKAPPPPPPVTIYNWSGFYLGGQVGGAFSDSSWSTDATVNGVFVPVDHSKDNWIAGGQVGYRQQWGNWVLGVEGMWSATDLKTFEISSNLVNLGFPDRFRGTKIDQIYSVTGQVGYAWDRWLGYAKGGWAGASVDLSTLNGITGTTSSVSGNASGWTIGAGIEYAFAPNWSLAVEYNFYDLSMGDKFTTQTNGASATYTGFDTQVHTVMGRLNYTFNWAKSPVVARY